MRWLRRAWLLCCVRVGAAAIYHFDDARPALEVGGSPVRWHSGGASQLILSSLLVRAHPRGLMFKPRRWHLRDLGGLGWAGDGCVSSSKGLCEKRDGSVVFPSHQTPVVGQDFVDGCASASTGRAVTNSTRYDPSACDVLDAKWDYFFTGSTIRRARTELPEWVYWGVCVLVLYLVRCLSKYVLASLAKGAAKGAGPPLPDPVWCLSACAGCTLAVIGFGDACFITEEDLLFYRFTLVYILAYACLFIGARGCRALGVARVPDPPFYNLLAGVLQLVASRLYVGAETPYNPPLVFVVAVRAMVKSRRGGGALRAATLLLDACMLSLMCALGFSPDRRYLVAVFTGAAAWADFLV